jgi:hypothetical protein
MVLQLCGEYVVAFLKKNPVLTNRVFFVLMDYTANVSSQINPIHLLNRVFRLWKVKVGSRINPAGALFLLQLKL